MPGEQDRAEICNQLGRFARILDAKAWDRIGEVFAPDIVFDYGDGGEREGLEALREQFSRYLDRCGPSQHLIGSVMIADEGGVESRAYVQARHQGRGANAHLFLDTNGEYVDRWEQREGAWRIVRRDAHWAMHMGDFGVFDAGD